MPTLAADGSPVFIEGINQLLLIRTPRLTGSADLIEIEESTSLLDAILYQHEVSTSYRIQIEVDQNPHETLPVTRPIEDPNGPVIELAAPNPRPGWANALLSADEDGFLSWSFSTPIPDSPAWADVDRGAYELFQVASYSPPPTNRLRRLLPWSGTKLLQLITFRGNRITDYWEVQHRSYRLLALQSHAEGSYSFVDVPWSVIAASGTCLLFLHGTASQSEAAFSDMPDSLRRDLFKRYHGQIYAFDHPTLSQCPTDNARHLIQQLPDGVNLELDIVSHSRGGLVGRVLAEQQSELDPGNRTITVNKHIFVATPNRGTGLAKPTNYRHLVDISSLIKPSTTVRRPWR